MDPEDRPNDFIPQKFKSMREVEGYKPFIKERFERCLDLYLCPRVQKRRLNIDPESLVPQLPKPRDLRPFPTAMEMHYVGHKGAVTSIAVGPNGEYVASGSADHTVRLWEVDTGRCMKTWDCGAEVASVRWNPNPDLHLLAVAAGTRVLLIATDTGSADQTELTDALLSDAHIAAAKGPQAGGGAQEAAAGAGGGDDDSSDDEAAADGEAEKKQPGQQGNVRSMRWVLPGSSRDKQALEVQEKAGLGGALPDEVVQEMLAEANPDFDESMSEEDRAEAAAAAAAKVAEKGAGIRLVLLSQFSVRTVAWHRKGDYLASTAPRAGAASVQIHRLSRGRTQLPFKKDRGAVQCVEFHPTRPFFFVATQRNVRVYNLTTQAMMKKLQSGAKWISDITVHKSGDHVLLTSYDRRLCWFDLDLSSSPFKTLRYHTKAVRASCFHPKYPLMASCSDDGTVHVLHAKIFDDLMKVGVQGTRVGPRRQRQQ